MLSPEAESHIYSKESLVERTQINGTGAGDKSWVTETGMEAIVEMESTISYCR